MPKDGKMKMGMMRKIKKAIRNWWECRMKRCEYYSHYLAYGPAELTHIGYHSAVRLADLHFKHCAYSGPNLCPACSRWERTVRA